MPSSNSRLPKLWLPGKVVSQRLTVEDGQVAVVSTYDDGLVVTLFVVIEPEDPLESDQAALAG